jgi:hypothetical protein
MEKKRPKIVHEKSIPGEYEEYTIEIPPEEEGKKPTEVIIAFYPGEPLEEYEKPYWCVDMIWEGALERSECYTDKKGYLKIKDDWKSIYPELKDIIEDIW